jgi:CDP-diacylglycerol--glycerol-3-phosphate 3-phosphatidyltransferase
MNGLYALKPWYAARLGRLRRVLVARRVSPHTITAGGVAFGAAAGAVLGLVRPGPAAAAAVATLLAARLACANLDGGVARESGRATRFGTLTNEAGDRLAELATLAGLLVWAPPALVAAAGLAVGAPSRVSLMAMAAGSPRRAQDGPFGKTERCVVLVAVALTGWATPLLLALIAGCLVTVGVRLRGAHRMLRES